MERRISVGIPTEICGPPPEVIPNIPVRRNQNKPFHLNSDRNFRNLWHNGKHFVLDAYQCAGLKRASTPSTAEHIVQLAVLI